VGQFEYRDIGGSNPEILSESSAGSDVASIRTYARMGSDGDFIINGAKQWITNAHQADWICLLANTDMDGPPHRNKSLICVDLNEPGTAIEATFAFTFNSTSGVKLGKRIEKLGMHSSDTGQ